MDDVIKELTFIYDAIGVYIKPNFIAHLSHQNWNRLSGSSRIIAKYQNVTKFNTLPAQNMKYF